MSDTSVQNPPVEAVVPARRRSRVCLAVILLAVAVFALLMLLSPSSPEPGAAEPRLLSEPERQFLWDVEHRGTLLSAHGFKQLASAIKAADREAVGALLAPGFTAEIPDRPQVVRSEAEGLLAVREEVRSGQSQEVSSSGFVDYVLAHRGRFTAPPGISASLMRFRPLDRAALSGDWEGSLRLRLQGECGEASPCEVTLFMDFGLTEPTEESLAAGEWLSWCRVTETLVARADRYLMRDVTSEWGVAADQFHDNWKTPQRILTTPGGVYLFDSNRDGVQDLLITDVTHPVGNVLYQGRPGGGFDDVTQEVGLPPSRSNMAIVADLDNDGWEDIVLGVGMVLRNEEGQRYTYVSRSNLPIVGEFSSRRSNGAAVADFDRDGLLDLYLTRSSDRPDQGSWLEGHVSEENSNLLLRNLGDFQFEDVTAEFGLAGLRKSTFTAVWLDADNDGWPDLYVINEFGNGVLMVNDGGKRFEPHEFSDRPADFGSMGATAGDLDNDGWCDLYIASMYSKSGARVISNLPEDAYPPDVMHRFRTMVAGSQLWRNQAGLRFSPQAQTFRIADVGWAYGPALADFDNDGWQDLYATAGFISLTRDEPDG